MLWKIKCCAVILVIIVLCSGCGPKLSAVDHDPIDASTDPVQTPCVVQQAGIHPVTGGQLIVTPMAIYKIAAVVESKKRYYFDTSAELAPYDLALAWGRLIDPGMNRFISYSQGGRWYYFHYGPDCPVDQGYIYTHSANNHIIPANNNVLEAVGSIRVGETVVLEGYLVNIDGNLQGANFYWHSSLTRGDTGNGACEVFYVQKVRIGDLVYQ